MRIKENQATVLFIRGIPGSGKSTIAKFLSEKIKADILILDPDSIDYQGKAYLNHVETMKIQGVDPKLFAYRFLRQQAYDGIEAKKLVIWNQPFSNLEIFNKMTKRLYDFAKVVGVKLKIIVVEVEIDSELAYSRIKDRIRKGGHGPTRGRFEKFTVELTSFKNTNDQVINVDGTSADKASDKIIDELKENS